ncbi:adenylate/guanylate cyclase domain-containing protein (plasmid) [Fulvitalea axinellae]|uniref:Adenylate/guanylate cyclase domain-containing protein n=1 Tax=Fulvitalea axinellae TaxID=1182444 RepID=A0AAU9DDG9_9BACT|nr:adenylate/guanylate cyclase domain-containing protein [Fulvitalea axinellae]
MSHVKIFVSYSHKDTEYIGKDGLLGFLRGLEVGGDVELWVDEKLTGGDKWDDVLKHQIQTCDIGLIFVSQAFLDSHYCLNIEVSSFLDRCRRDGMKIFPIILSPCEWELHPWISDYQCLPTNGETIEENYLNPGERKRLFLKIRKELRHLIEQVREERLLKAATPSGVPEVNAERRNVTLLQLSLAVDAHKYDMDPEDKLEFLHEAAPLVKEVYISEAELYEGFVINMSGTGQISICFGYPKASELDSVKAIRTALGILNSAEKISDKLETEWDVRLKVKAGVHTGLMIGRTGSDTQHELEQGLTSTAAHAIMRASSGSEILVSESTYRLIKNFFECEERDSVYNHDSGEKTRCWGVTKDLGINSRFEASAASGLIPIVGRDREVGIIMERWGAAAHGKGQMVSITSEAGVGKSRLTQEVKNRISALQSQLFSCQFSPFHKNSSLYSLIKAYQSWLGITDTDSDEEKLRKVEAVVRNFEWSDDEIIAIIANVFGIKTPYPAPALKPNHLKNQVFEIFFSILVETAHETPLLVILEDLHWMDPSTMEWLELVFREIPTTNIMVICTTRPEFHLPIDWNSESYFHPMKLHRLTKEEISEMILKITDGKSIPLQLFDEICRKTEGYPLFVEDLTTMVLESDMLLENDGVYSLAKPLEPLSIPDTLQESLMARLNKLEGGRLVAQLGAVIGREFSFELICEIAPLERGKLQSVFNRLVDAGIMYKRGLLSRVVYIFKHALIQDALYESLLKRKRKEYHRKIAKVIEDKFPQVCQSNPEMVSIHFSKAGNFKKSVEYGILACKKASSANANLETVNLSQNVLKDLAELPETDERNQTEKDILLMRGPALLAVKGWSSPEIGETYTRAKDLCHLEKSPDELVKITRGLWGYYMVSSQLENSLEIANELLALGDKYDSDNIRLEAHATLCDSYFWLGNLAEAEKNAEAGLAIYNFDDHHLKHANAYGEDPSGIMYCYLGIIQGLKGKDSKAANTVGFVEENHEKYTHLFSQGFLMNGVAWHYMNLHKPEQTLLWGEQLKNLSVKEEFPPWLALAKTHVGWAKAVLVDVDEGVKELLEGIAEWNSAGMVVSTGFAYAMVCDAYIKAKRFEEAEKYADIGIAHNKKYEEKHFYSEILRYKAEILARNTATQNEADEFYQQSLAVAEKQQAPVLIQRTKDSYASFSSLRSAT